MCERALLVTCPGDVGQDAPTHTHTHASPRGLRSRGQASHQAPPECSGPYEVLRGPHGWRAQGPGVKGSRGRGGEAAAADRGEGRPREMTREKALRGPGARRLARGRRREGPGQVCQAGVSL